MVKEPSLAFWDKKHKKFQPPIFILLSLINTCLGLNRSVSDLYYIRPLFIKLTTFGCFLGAFLSKTNLRKEASEQSLQNLSKWVSIGATQPHKVTNWSTIRSITMDYLPIWKERHYRNCSRRWYREKFHAKQHIFQLSFFSFSKKQSIWLYSIMFPIISLNNPSTHILVNSSTNSRQCNIPTLN